MTQRADVLLNPLDARSPRWSPFFEAESPRDYEMMASALIPQQKDTVDPFWVTAARQLFANGATVLWRKGERRNRVLVENLLKTKLEELAQAMEGTVAQSIIDVENPKTALSVRAMLTAHIGAMEFLPDTGRPFSIRQWISREDGDGFLFLTSRGDQHASLRGLISTWLEVAVNSLLSLPHDDGRRVWVILDELPTLHQVPSLQPGLAESRQFGGCFVLGVQVASALRDLYGRNGAETISGLCGTRVVLAAPDRDTAQWSADSLGRSEIEEVAEGVSYGANTIRDGVSLTPRRELRSLALPSEIMRLENLHGYLKFPGPWPVAQIKLDYVNRPKIASRYVPRTPGSDREQGKSDEAATADRHGTEGGATASISANTGGAIDMFSDQWELDLAPGGTGSRTVTPIAGDAAGEFGEIEKEAMEPPESELASNRIGECGSEPETGKRDAAVGKAGNEAVDTRRPGSVDDELDAGREPISDRTPVSPLETPGNEPLRRGPIRV